ncbi:hypothetical protein [Ehrlichia canis]|uniref:hypothetical protein n=1 Tax=Ehrlichia canis TaxID=944 RepID=UPI001F37C912|nr:hypothetical protein [Ehrlichia canis]UKC53527.1 hypothetical protein s20019040002_000570 [Ehrlichia canis]UKC54465.1 hypothetical protein s20026770001_000571 [Ehrlichia canis]UKC55401.1 hypothetical protein s21009500007_000571 [Ehrlichia canis]
MDNRLITVAIALLAAFILIFACLLIVAIYKCCVSTKKVAEDEKPLLEDGGPSRDELLQTVEKLESDFQRALSGEFQQKLENRSLLRDLGKERECVAQLQKECDLLLENNKALVAQSEKLELMLSREHEIKMIKDKRGTTNTRPKTLAWGFDLIEKCSNTLVSIKNSTKVSESDKELITQQILLLRESVQYFLSSISFSELPRTAMSDVGQSGVSGGKNVT